MQDTEPAAGERTGLLSMLTLVEALSRALTTTQVAEAVFRHVLPAIGAAAGTLVLRADERDARAGGGRRPQPGHPGGIPAHPARRLHPGR